MDENPLARELALYEAYRHGFEEKHRWEWIVIHGEEVVGFYTDFQDAAEVTVERYGRGPYLIRQIGVPRPSLPSSVRFRPVDPETKLRIQGHERSQWCQ